MKLDYYAATDKFVLSVPRDRDRINMLMKEHGLNFAESASTAMTAAMVTDNAYAASAYSKHATDRAKNKLRFIMPAIKASWMKEGAGAFSVPDGVDLWPYQKGGVTYCLQRDRALIGDEPGLGKTAMAIVSANERRANSVLVICPANIRLQWAKQIRAWSTMEGKYIVYPILKSSDGVHPRAEWTVISYDLLSTPAIANALAAKGFDFVIVDEAHYLKTASARRTAAVFGESGIASNCGAVLCLTGTPLPNRPRECFTLAKALDWSSIDYMKEKEFRERFNPMRVAERRCPETGGVIGRRKEETHGRAPELQARLRANFMVRRKKRDVLDQLPKIRYEIVHTDEDGDIKKALEAEKMLDIDPTDLRGSSEVLGHISTIRKMMGVAKAPHVAEYIKMLLNGGEEKLVVFGWHIEVLDILEQALHKHGVVRVDGSTSAPRRQMAVDRFIDDPNCKVFLGNLKSVGVGVDGLQKACSHGIFAECSWTPSDNDQGVGRLERFGQLSGIFIEFIVAPRSFDERVLQTSLKKLRGIHSALDEQF